VQVAVAVELDVVEEWVVVLKVVGATVVIVDECVGEDVDEDLTVEVERDEGVDVDLTLEAEVDGVVVVEPPVRVTLA
jgi:hypothetical protein